MISTFTGTLAGTSYTDPDLFAQDVKAAGLVAKHPYTPQTLGKRAFGEPPAKPVLTKAEREWLGQAVNLRDGRQGQVWALHPSRSHVWVVLNGQAVGVHTEELTRSGGYGQLPLQPVLPS